MDTQKEERQQCGNKYKCWRIATVLLSSSLSRTKLAMLPMLRLPKIKLHYCAFAGTYSSKVHSYIYYTLRYLGKTTDKTIYVLTTSTIKPNGFFNASVIFVITTNTYIDVDGNEFISHLYNSSPVTQLHVTYLCYSVSPLH